MNSLNICAFITLLLPAAWGVSQWHGPNCAENRVVIVHLFEWKWTDIAAECERFLGPRGFCGVQVSPANEHAMVTTDAMRPWWERYQPVSYKLTSRSGTEEEFIDMVNRCNKANVRIYVDIILNHMAGVGRSGKGSAGSDFIATDKYFPGVPYDASNFNPRSKCNSDTGSINNYGDAEQVRNCMLNGLTDLDQSNANTRGKMVNFLNRYVEIGVAGFRVDAAKHMWPKDLEAILLQVNDLNSNFYPPNTKPFFYHEVIDMSNEPIKGQHYSHMGRVCDFRYCTKIREKIYYNDIGSLRSVYDPGWGMLPPEDAFIFVDNHDNQRGHGASGHVLTFKDPPKYRRGIAFTLANDYGYPRIMSSYQFDSEKEGPPHHADYTTKDVTINADGSCGNGWVCEHRWRAISAMVGFAKAAQGTKVEKFWQQGNNIGFSRGEKAFFVISGDGRIDATIATNLPSGRYCNVITGCPTDTGCEAEEVIVDGSGNVQVHITDPNEPMFAIHVEAKAGSGSCSGGSGQGPEVTVPPVTSSTAPVTSPTSPVTTDPTKTPTSSSVTTPGPTTTPGPEDWRRTVVFLKKHTQSGQDVFLRGGINHSQRPGCTSDAKVSPCAVSISHNSLGTSSHYDKQNAWRAGDEKCDWYGAEQGQGSYHGQPPEGSPSVWTSNDPNSSGYQQLNKYGSHYWMLDANINCAETENGWFEFKGLQSDSGWEHDISQSASCGGDVGGSKPYHSTNHFARCGYVNVFEWGSGECLINNF